MRECSHRDLIREVTPSGDGCEDCLSAGEHEWFHLRLCLICGHVGCCDASPRGHATAHWEATGHPILRSFQPGEDWGWCMADNLLLLPDDLDPPAVPGSS